MLISLLWFSESVQAQPGTSSPITIAQLGAEQPIPAPPSPTATSGPDRGDRTSGEETEAPDSLLSIIFSG